MNQPLHHIKKKLEYQNISPEQAGLITSTEKGTLTGVVIYGVQALKDIPQKLRKKKKTLVYHIQPGVIKSIASDTGGLTLDVALGDRGQFQARLLFDVGAWGHFLNALAGVQNIFLAEATFPDLPPEALKETGRLDVDMHQAKQAGMLGQPTDALIHCQLNPRQNAWLDRATKALILLEEELRKYRVMHG